MDFDNHVFNVYLKVPADLVDEDFFHQVVVCCPVVFIPNGIFR